VTLVTEFSGILPVRWCKLIKCELMSAVSEDTGAHVAVELQHVIVTNRQLNEITAFCLRRMLNVTLHEAAKQGKQQDKMCWKPQ